MHAVMIVDDEPLMLKYLNENINRIAPDWHVTGLASDGLQAVSLLQRQDFDLVITDIKMPEMDGLELAKFIYEIYPQTKVVIISGFDDFDYARRAIRCGVSDYLLKPLSDENITDTLNKISENIEESASKAFSDHILSKSEKFTDIELKSAFLNAVIQNNLAHIKSLYAVIHRRGIWQTDPFSCIMVLSADSASLLKQGYDYPKITSCKIHLNQQCVESFQNSSRATVCYCDYDNTAILVCEKSKDQAEQAAKSIFDEANRLFQKEHSINLLGAYGSIAEDTLCLQESFSTASQALILSLAGEVSPVPPVDFIRQRIFLNGIHTLIASIYSDFISYNESKMRADLTNFIELFPKQPNLLISLRFGIYLIYNITQKSKMKKEHLERAFQQLALLLKSPDSDFSAEKYTATVLQKSLFSLNKAYDSRGNEETSGLVDKAREYIYSHYSEPISLTLVAEKLGVSASYLSDLFHKEFGELYSKFVTRVRMEQAITLMKANPNEKIYTIATQVGFVNAKHFNSVFKKFYHMTPTEFLQKNS